MRAVGVYQPFATLLGMGAKGFETRRKKPAQTVIGQRVALHACKKREWLPLAETEPFKRRLDAGVAAGTLVLVDGSLPLGRIVATAVLEYAFEITPRFARDLRVMAPEEYAFGDYTPGRWVWVFRDSAPLARPFEWTGRQGFFSVPDEQLLAGGWEPREGEGLRRAIEPLHPDAAGFTACRTLRNGVGRSYSVAEATNGWNGLDQFIRQCKACGFLVELTGDTYAVLNVLEGGGEIVQDYGVRDARAWRWISRKLGFVVVTEGGQWKEPRIADAPTPAADRALAR